MKIIVVPTLHIYHSAKQFIEHMSCSLKQEDMKGYVSIVLEWEMHVSHFIGSRIQRGGGGGTQDTCNNVSGQRGPEPYFSLKCKSMTVVQEKWVHGPCEWKFSKKDMNVVHWHFTKKCAWTFNNEMKGMGINMYMHNVENHTLGFWGLHCASTLIYSERSVYNLFKRNA